MLSVLGLVVGDDAVGDADSVVELVLEEPAPGPALLAPSYVSLVSTPPFAEWLESPRSPKAFVAATCGRRCQS